MKSGSTRWIILVFFSLLPDLIQVGLFFASKSPALPHNTKLIIDTIRGIGDNGPQVAALFALFFALGWNVAMSPKYSADSNNVVAFLILVPAVNFILTIVSAALGGPLGQAGINTYYVYLFLYGMSVALIAKGCFDLRVEIAGSAIVGFAALILGFVATKAGIPFPLILFLHTAIGIGMASVAANMRG